LPYHEDDLRGISSQFLPEGTELDALLEQDASKSNKHPDIGNRAELLLGRLVNRQEALRSSNMLKNLKANPSATFHQFPVCNNDINYSTLLTRIES